MFFMLPLRFWEKVQKTESCWLWVGARTKGGYGLFRHQGVAQYAHRLSYSAEKGPIPQGLHIDHLCRVRNCVNPVHLEAVTKKENDLRGLGQGGLNARKTHCPRGHEYDESNTYLYRGNRQCLICRRSWKKRKAHSKE
jgi:hypothetical protein